METYMLVIYLLEFIIIGLVFYSVREIIYERIYGRRFKHYVELDTGKMGYCILAKNLDSVKIDGITKSINWNNIKHGMIFLYNNLAENVTIEYDNNKARFYMNSNEFNTLINNNVYEKLLISKAEKLIQIITVLVGIVLVLGIYQAYTLHQLQPYINEIYNQVSTMVSQTVSKSNNIVVR